MLTTYPTDRAIAPRTCAACCTPEAEVSPRVWEQQHTTDCAYLAALRGGD